MLKNRNKWFYAFIVATVLLVAAAVAIVVISGNTEKPSQIVEIPEGPETGVYYYSVEQGEIILSLNNGNKFTIAGPGMNRTGTYTVSGQEMSFTFVQGSDVATAVVGEGVVTMTYNGNVMTFLKQVNYTVTFDTNGGSSVASASVCNGKLVSAPADPTKEGYVFIGWYADAACKTAYQFTNAITDNVTVYAGWVEKQVGIVEFTANFDLGYEGAEMEAMSTINGKLYNLATPERSGFTFGGWFISMYEDGQKLTVAYNEDTVLTADTTLFAVWHENGGSKLANPDVSVTTTGLKWNAVNGASAYQVKVLDAKGNVVHEESLGATSMNFNFANLESGDYTVEVIAVSSNTANNSEATVRYFRNKALDRVSKFQVINGMLVFNAVANAENYLITIDCGNKDHNHTMLNNGNSTVYNFSNCSMQEGGIRFTVVATANGYADSVAQTFVYDRSLSAVENLTYDAANDQFIWNAVENATGYVATITVGGATFTVQTGTSTYLSLAAYTGEISVSVAPVTAGYNSPAAVTATCTKTAPAAPQNVQVNDMVITWDEVEGATKYEVKVGSVTYEVTTNSVDLVEKKFDASLGMTYTILVKAIVGGQASSYSQAVNAQYKNMDTNLSYKGNKVFWTPVLGGTNFDVRVNGGETVRVSDVNFATVVLTKAGINVIEVKCADLSSAEWVSIEVFAYEVTYYSRTLGGEVSEFVAIGDTMMLPDHFTNEGYDFAGWYNTPGAATGNGMQYAGNVFTGNGNMALYANWSPKDYPIEFVVDSTITNITNLSTQDVTYTKHFVLPPAVSSDNSVGYFVGWYTGPSGTGIQVTDSNGNSVAPYDVIGKTTVYPYFADALDYELLKDGTYGVKQGLGLKNKSLTEIVIPATYKDIPVTQIIDNAFLRCYDIVSVKMPDTITRVGIGAFERCDSLESIEVYVVDPDSTQEKFYSSYNGALLYYDVASGNTYLEVFPRAKTGVFTVPEGVDNIRPYAFKYSKINKVIISKGVTYVAESAFYQCKSLTTIEFEFGREDSVTIAVDAFNDLPKVETLILPAKLNVIEDLKTLDKLTALKNIIMEEGGENYSVNNNLLCDGLGTSLLYVPNYFSGVFEAPMGITTIGDAVFAGKSSVTEVIIPAYVTNIGVGAFESCTNIEKVTIRGNRNNELVIANDAFTGCVSLYEIVMEGSTKATSGAITLGENSFGACENLEKLTIGANVIVSSIGTRAFAKDVSLSDLIIDDTAVISQIGEYAFTECLSIKTYVVHASTTSVGSFAFLGCSYLETVEFAPNGGQIAFGEGVFQDCVRLTTIKLPATLSAFDGSVFDGCEHISTVEVDPGNPFLETKDGALYTMGLTELIYYPRNLDADLSKLPWDTLTKIGPAVFKGNVKVTNVVIGSKIVEIGAGAFANCINLTDLTFANMESTMIIGNNAFDNCTKLTEIAVPSKTTSIGNNAFYMTKISQFVIPATVTYVGDFAFAYTNLTEITIPAAVTYVGQGAFYKATALANVTFVGGTEPLVIGTVDLVKTSVEKTTTGDEPVLDTRGTFVGTALTQITLPSNISVIGDFAFDGLTAFNSVVIPADAQLKQLGMNAFNKTSITQINLGQQLEFIGEHALAQTKLTTVTIPGTVQHLRAYALSTSTLTEIIFAPSNAEDANLTVYNFALLGTSVVEITFPAHLTMIGVYDAEYAYHTVGDVFYKNTSYVTPAGINDTTTLAKIHVAEGGAVYGSLDGILYAKGAQGELLELQFCPKGNTGDIVVPNTVVHVQHSAIVNTGLSSIVFEEFDKDDERYGQPLLNIGAYTELKSTCPVVIGTTSSGTIYTNLTYIHFPSHLGMVASQGISGLRVDTKKNPNWTLELDFNPDAMVAFKAAAIRNNGAITKMTLPMASEIARYALSGNGATEITFAPGSTVSEIGEFAFTTSRVTTFVLPASVRLIGRQAFSSCTNMVSFTQEENGCLESIGDEAFQSCNAFTTFKIPDTVSIVGSNAFKNCQNLVTLEISANMETAEAGKSSIVESCKKLTAIIVPDNHPYMKSVDGVLYDKQETILFLYPLGKGVMTTAIPDTVHTIAAGAFYGYEGTSITLPESLRYINNHAFAYSKIENLYIPAGVLEIGYNAFYSLSNLKTVTFGENAKLEAIGDYAFSSCGALEAISIPDGVTYIGQQSFMSCRSLKTIIMPAALKVLASQTLRYCSGLESVVLQEGLEEMGASAMQYCSNLKSVVIPDSVIKMGNYMFSSNTVLEEVLMSEYSQMTEIGNGTFYSCPALKKVTFGPQIVKFGYESINSSTQLDTRNIFEGCTALEEVRMPDALTELPDILFRNCVTLTSVNLPASLKTIGKSTFAGCVGLTEITLFASLESIGADAFAGCTGLTTVNVESGCGLKRIADGAFENTVALTGIDLPSTITYIGNRAFMNSGVANAPIPASLTKVGDYAFYGCANLTTIGIPSTVTHIGAYAFAGCENVESLALSVGLKNIGDFAFADCVKIEEVTIPQTVAFMGANPFANCTSLTSVAVENGNESFKVIDGVILDKTGYTLICYPTYKTEATFEIPESVYEIAGGAFAGSKLQNIVLPDNIRKIADGAFRNSQLLETVVIPGNVSSIDAHAFQDCVSLNNVVIPAAVANLGEYAFAGCTSLTNLILEDRKVEMTVGAHLFDGCTSLTTVYEFPGVNRFSDYMYANTGFVNLVIPNGYTDLGAEGVFAYCANLQSVQFPSNSGNRIGGRFFKGCSALVSINLPNSITTLGTAAVYNVTPNVPPIGEVFMDCTSLQSVSFNVSGLYGESTFENCVNLTNVAASQMFTVNVRTFANCSKLTTAILSKVNSIESEAFLNCIGLVGDVDLSHVRNFANYGLSGCVNLGKVTVGNMEMQINDYAFAGLTANTTIYFKNATSLEAAIQKTGNMSAKWYENTEAQFTFKTVSSGGGIDYSLTGEEQKMVNNFCEMFGIKDSAMVGDRLVAYKSTFNELNPGKEIGKEEMAMFMGFLEELGCKADEKMMQEAYMQWAEYKQTLAKQLAERFALTEAEQKLVMGFCEMVGTKMMEEVEARLLAYKASFTDTEHSKEISKEEQEQLRMFLEELGCKADEKIMGMICEQWLAYKNGLVDANKPAATKSYLTEKEIAQLEEMVGKMEISPEALDAIKAAWSDWKLNFTDTKFDKGMVREWCEELRGFLVKTAGVDEKSASLFVEMAEGMWADYAMQLAEKNAKAQVTDEEMDMLRNLMEMGMEKGMLEVAQNKLFNYKRFFSETEVSKELTDEEMDLLSAFLEEIGLDAKMAEKMAGQWIEYKMMLIKTMSR